MFRSLNAALTLLLLVAANGPAHARDLEVAPGHTIAAAVRVAAPGDTIRVAKGEYHERLLLDKPVKLVGVDRPTLSGDDVGDVIRVTATDVTVEGFILRDSGADLGAQNACVYVQPGAHRASIRHNDFAHCLFGLWIEGVDRVEVASNIITGKRELSSPMRGNGIQLYNTHFSRILDNEVSFTRDGIYVDVSHDAVFRGNRMHHLRYGTHYMNSYRNLWEDNESHHNRGGLALMEVRDQVVRNNRAWDNTDHGIMLRTIQDSLIENNVVAGNARGFFIYDAEFNTLRGNLVINNRVGVHLWAGSVRNEVDGNDFIDNHEQIRFVAAKDELWGKRKGNYWSNYLGWDRNGDGKGDVPYEANDLVDRLTWQHPEVKLLLNSPAIQTLRLVARQFPLLRAPSIVDAHPNMHPYSNRWSNWLGQTRH